MKRHAATAIVAALAMAGAAWAGSGCPASGSACGSKKAHKCGGMKAEKACTGSSSESYGKIDTAGLKSLLDSGSTVTIVDARTAQWDDGKRLPGAISLPADSSAEAIAAALPSKDALIVAYCSSLKCPASANLASELVKLGYKNVVKYPEGLADWIEAGHSVTEAPKTD